MRCSYPLANLGDYVTVQRLRVSLRPGVVYRHYSLPAFDAGRIPEVVDGSLIRSSKLAVDNEVILMNKLNVRFKRVWPVIKAPENSVASTEFIPLVPSGIDYWYLYYILLSPGVTSNLTEMCTGTSGSHQRVNVKDLLNLEIPLPSLSVQRQIGAVLQTLDAKIELNNRLNGYLEELLLAKYDDMFGRNSRLNGTLSDIGEIVGGATPSKKCSEFYCSNGIGWITPRDLSNTRDKYVARGAVGITESGLASCSTTLLPRGSILFSSRAPIGYIAIASSPVATNQGFKSVVPKPGVGTAFCYCLLKRSRQRIIDVGAGTTFAEVSGKVMRSIEIFVPNKDALAEFTDLVRPLLLQQERLEQENRCLASVRDALLPRLMSGEIDVSKIDVTQLANSH